VTLDDKLNKNFENLNENDDLKKKYSEAENLIKQLKSQITELENKISSLTKNKNEFELQFKELNEINKNNEKAKNDLIEQKNNLEKKISELEEQNDKFKNNEENEINQYQNLYKIDMKIFDNPKFISKPQDENNYIIDNVCYIKTTHHIKGKLFIQKNIQNNNSKINNTFNNFFSLSPKMSSLFFMESNSFDNDYLLKHCEDYDSVHST
jgi:chromosome segregation ATPase